MWFVTLCQLVQLLECLLDMLPARGDCTAEQYLARLQNVKTVEILAKL